MRLKYNIHKAAHFIMNPYNAVFLIAWGLILLGYWRGINNHLPVLGNMTDELECVIILFPLFLSLSKFFKRLKTIDHIIVFSLLLCYTMNFILFPLNEEELMKRWFNFSILTVPFYYIGVTLDIKKFLNAFYIISIVAVVVCSAYELLYLHSSAYIGDADTSEYNMNLSYKLLPHVLMVSWQALKESNFWKIAVMLLGVIMLLSFGTRGPVACAITFIAIYMLFIRTSKYQNIIRVVVISLFVLVFSFLNQFVLFMQALISQIGMSTRIFDKYLSGELSESLGRDYIRETIMRELSIDTSLLGHGILGSYRYVGTYPHNIILDFIFSFGWFFGIVLLFLLFLLIVKMIAGCRHDETRMTFGILLIISSILKLCFSGTYVDDTLFFLLLGYCVQIIWRNKKTIL